MSEWTLTALALTLLTSAAAWRWPWRPGVARSGPRLWLVIATAAGLAGAAGCALLTSSTPDLLVAGRLLAAGCAIIGGGPVTAALLRVAPDGSGPAPPAQTLRAGATIGLLERTAVVATLQAGWPEGLAVAMAIKALGRYPELRQPGTSERFIVGTFCSVLWAAGCSGISVIG